MGKAGTERQKWSSKVTQFLFEFKLGLFRAHLRTILHSASLCMGIFIGRYLLWYLYLRDLSKVLLKATEGFPINGVQRFTYLHSHCSKQCWSLEASELLGRCGGSQATSPRWGVGSYLGSKDPRRVKERVERHKEESFHSLTVETCQNTSGLSELVYHGRFFQETSKLYLPKWH